MIKYLLILLLSSVFAFKKCSSVDNLGISNVVIVPENPIPGLSASVQISGSANVVNSGVLLVDVRVFGVKVAEESFNFCSLVKCPLSGNYNLKFSHEIPVETPELVSANVKVSLVVNNVVASCIDTVIKTGQRNSTKFIYSKWKKMYNKTDKFNVKLETFMKNYQYVKNNNNLELNKYADMTNAEFVYSKFNTVKNYAKLGQCFGTPYVRKLKTVPEELDYTKKGIVTRVKNQGQCGSCWAFAAVAAIESAYSSAFKISKEFSEQQVVSCDSVDLGCRGGTQDHAFEFVKKAGGLCEEKDYAYTSGSGISVKCLVNCKKDPNTVPKKIVDISPNEDDLMAALVEHGPVVVDIEADQAVFQFYKSGVISKWCGAKLDHAVLLVGYGHDNKTGLDYWKLKNSWGSDWGEDGYVRIERHKKFRIHGLCGIASSASFPVL